MTKDEAKEVKGLVEEIVVLSNGEYSDYSIEGVFKVKKELNQEVLSTIWEELNKGTVYISYSDLVMLLLSEGYVERIEYKEIYLGAYNDIKLELY